MKIRFNEKYFEIDTVAHPDFLKIIPEGWEKETFDIFDNFMSSKDTVIDIGCWVGTMSLYAADIVSKVYAIEPDPVSISLLKKNIALNSYLQSKIEVRNIALTDKTKEVVLYTRDTYGLSTSSTIHRTRDKGTTIKVQGISFKDFIASENITKVDFIKMDIEGGEFILLPSIINELKKLNLPTLYVSFHYNYLKEYIYLNYFKTKFFSKAVMKIEKWTDTEFLKYILKKEIRKALRDIDIYQNVYTEKGDPVEHSKLKTDPLLIKKYNLVFTNQRWKK